MIFVKHFLVLMLVLTLLLSGCGGNTAPAEPSAEATEATTLPVTEAPTTAPTEPEVTEVSGFPCPLTGELLPQKRNNRPFAVTINNIVDAMPQCGIRDADILYEVLAEGGITRTLAIYHDLEKTGPIGSIRSARPYLLDLAMAYDAVYVHAGGSGDAYNDLSETGWDHIDGVRGSNASSYYYRDQDRLSVGYSLEHTLFITGEDVIAYAKERECEMTRPNGVSYGLQFAEEAAPNGVSAKNVTVDFASSSKTTGFLYNPDTGLYKASQYGGDYVDGFSGEPMQFKNVLMLTADTSYDSDGYRVYIDLTGTGEGFFACGGKMVPILWSRENAEAPFVYTLADGTPLTLGVGTSYIAITPYGSEMICE